jgi:hypothetical protein
MMRIFIMSLIVLLVAACGQQQSAVNAPEAARIAAPSKMAVQSMARDAVMGGAEASLTEISEPQQDAVNAEIKKYIALRHHLTLEMPAKAMQANFDAAIGHCERLGCQLLSANYNRETPYSPPSASISLRVPPRNVEIFLSGLAKNSEIMQHGREAEDKTNQVVDADARIKNLTELRDRLRAMLRHQSAQFKDIIEVERELANTQSQLDSIMSMRKVLALETELVAVNIEFTAAQGITEQGFFAPVAQALKEAGHVMMESLASLITLIVSAIPWLLIGIPLLFLIRKFWIKIKKGWFA